MQELLCASWVNLYKEAVAVSRFSQPQEVKILTALLKRLTK